MIWDMACQINGKSVNDYLMNGPNLYSSLVKIQFQMQEFEILIKADLSEMFHQIKLLVEDTDALRFVFRFNNEEQRRHFKMVVLPFGAKCSPSITHYIKNLVA